jgi:hypothetical protein
MTFLKGTVRDCEADQYYLNQPDDIISSLDGLPETPKYKLRYGNDHRYEYAHIGYIVTKLANFFDLGFNLHALSPALGFL